MYQNILVLGAVTVEHGCDCCRTGTRSACPGLTAAALPDTHLELVVTQYIDELGVDALGESRVVLKVRADLLEIQTVYIFLLKQDAVRVAHTDRGCRVGHTVYGQIGACLLGQGAGDLTGGQDGSAHVHAYLNDLAVFRVQGQVLDARQRLDRDLGAVTDHAIIVQVFAHAADTVAAHFTLTAVGVEHAHFCVCDLGRTDQNDAVTAYAEVHFREANGELRRVFD